MRVLVVLLLLALPLEAQEHSPAPINPLATLKQQLSELLAAAGTPFSDEQERAILLMLEERRQAFERLFGGLMDFRDGPTSVQEAARLQSALDWMQQEFLRRVRNYLTESQLAVWEQFESSGAFPDGSAGRGGPPRPAAQTQYVRIANNAFTSEAFAYRGGAQGGAEVIQRGGAGVWYGTARFTLQDEALNARNAFAGNKPPYQARQFNVDAGGPAIRGRLTAALSASHNEAENVDTVHATLPDGVFALGITRPTVNRALGSRQTLQLSDAHSLRGTLRYTTQNRRNQGVGGFNLPERAFTFDSEAWHLDVRQFAALPTGSLFETRVTAASTASRSVPASEAVRVNVLDAFSAGGSQNRSSSRGRTYAFETLYTRLGGATTLKTGLDGTYRTARSAITNNFGGTFTFSSLDAYRAGLPLTYRVTRGEPEQETTQLEVTGFIQNDLKLTSRFMLMLGARYDAQTNLNAPHSLSPRLGFAYGLGRSTVLRGGGGLFHDRLHLATVEEHRRLDGTRQFEIVIDEPSYPDPFGSGRIGQTAPSIRVTDPHLRAPSASVGMLSLEQPLWGTLLVTATYDLQREAHRFRLRNLNAPFDATAPVPRACRPEQPADTCVRPDPGLGNVGNLESTGNETAHNLRLTARQRFSIFNVSGTYILQRAHTDTVGLQWPTDNYDLRADWASSPLPRQTLNSTVNARLPLGIFLTSMTMVHSGRYYTITTGRDDNRDTVVNDRPAGVPRNSERGPRYFNVNFNISKAMFLADSGRPARNVNLFANMSNAFNRVHYGTPSGVMTSPNFGRPTSAHNPREVEVGLRVQF